MWNSELPEKFSFYFQEFFTSINKIFMLAGSLGYHYMKFKHFSDIFQFSKILCLS